MKKGQETERDKQIGCHADVCGGCENAALPLISPSARQTYRRMEGRGGLMLGGSSARKESDMHAALEHGYINKLHKSCVCDDRIN